MHLFQLIMQLVYPLALTAVPVWMHRVGKRSKRGLKPFFLSVAFRPNARRFIESVCLLALLILPMLYMRTAASSLWLLPTIGIIVPFFFHRVSEAMLFKLTSPSHFYVTAAVVFVCLYVPYLFPMAVTLATIMGASMLYPPRALVNELRHPSFVSKASALRSELSQSKKKLSITKIITLAYEK